MRLIFIVSALIAGVIAVAAGLFLYRQQQQTHRSPSVATQKKSSSAPSSLLVDVCDFSHLTKLVSSEASAAASSTDDIVARLSAPSHDRSAHAHHWIENATRTLLGFGTRVAGASNKGRRRSLKFLRDAVSCSSFGSMPGGWSSREDRFSQKTVVGMREFTNLLLSTNTNCDPATTPHVVVAAHWDSKLFSFEFLGACDSAVPVVMMMQMIQHLAVVTQQLGSNSGCVSGLPRVTFMFLDGEEAFVDWGRSNDNTYGSRHLAEVYEREGKIKGIDMFVLLDLLGPVNPTFFNYFPAQTGAAFQQVQAIEQRHRKNGQRRTVNPSAFFTSRPATGGVEDDHIPWLKRGVPVLHVIPLPFPPFWHEKGDDGSNIDYERTTVDLYNIFAEYVFSFKKKKQ